jgi:hypothetical protein
MQSRSWLILLAAAAAGAPVRAAPAAPAAGAAPSPAPWRRVVLVELFTSQGCSSCPPADAFVRALPSLGLARDRVLPLTFHVDYWDRLGWKDPFSSAAFTDRQAWYARGKPLRSPDGAAGLDGTYTPQLIVDGIAQLSGQHRETAIREMTRAAARPPLFDLRGGAVVEGDAVEVRIEVADRAGGPPDRDWRVVAALAARHARTAVPRGENAGETLDEVAVVRALSGPAPLPRSAPLTVRLAKPADLAGADAEVVVFVQSATTGEVAAALAVEPRMAPRAR